MSRTLANVAGVLAAGIAVLFVVFEVEMRTGGAHVSELTRVGMATLAVVGGGIHFTYRIVAKLIADDQEARPAVDEMHIARAAAKFVTDELAPQLKTAIESAYRAGLVAGAERASRTNGTSSGGYPKLAHLTRPDN